MASLADTTRSRILLLLERHELTVSELCTIVQLPQSTVSRHLKALADGDWIAARAEGTSHLYSMTRDLDSAARRLWLLVREQVGASPTAAQDQRRLQAALAERRTKSQEFFTSSAGQWDRVRDELFGDRFHLAALAAFAQSDWTVGDLGCGTGQVSAALAPFVARSSRSTARRRCCRPRESGCTPSTTSTCAAAISRRCRSTMGARCGDPDARPASRARAGARAADVARVLKPQGRAIIVDMLPHDRESYRQQMGHVWLGFSDEHVRRMFQEAGFEKVRVVAIPRTREPRARDCSSQPQQRHGNTNNGD